MPPVGAVLMASRIIAVAELEGNHQVPPSISAFSTGFVGQSGCIISKASIEKVFAGICHISLVCNNTILSFLVLFLRFSQSTS